jgi:hypothetical protein
MSLIKEIENYVVLVLLALFVDAAWKRIRQWWKEQSERELQAELDILKLREHQFVKG